MIVKIGVTGEKRFLSLSYQVAYLSDLLHFSSSKLLRLATFYIIHFLQWSLWGIRKDVTLPTEIPMLMLTICQNGG